jgi:hypothetical protein
METKAARKAFERCEGGEYEIRSFTLVRLFRNRRSNG